MPFAKRGLLKKTDVFEPRAVARTFAKAEAFKKALEQAEKEARNLAADSTGCLAVMLPWAISYTQYEITILQEALATEYKNIQALNQRKTSSDIPSPQIKSVEAKTTPSTLDPNSVTIPWLWFFTQQQPITEFINDLLATNPIRLSDSEPPQFALNDKQIAKIKRLNKLNPAQLENLMKGLNPSYHQLVKEHLLMNALLPDEAVDETYNEAYKNRNDSRQPWLGESAHYGNRTLSQLAEAILDHVIIGPNNKPQINPRIKKILNSIPEWSNLRNGDYVALKNALDEELQIALLKRIGTQFHFTSTDDLEESRKSLEEIVRDKLKNSSLSLHPEDQVHQSKTPATKQQPSKIYPKLILYNKPYFFLGFIPWGVTSVTVDSFTKDLLESDPGLDINVSQPTWTDLQKEKLRNLDSILKNKMGLLTPNARAPYFLLIKKQVEANLLAHMKNGMIQFGERKPKSITRISEIGHIANSLNDNIEKVIAPIRERKPKLITRISKIGRIANSLNDNIEKVIAPIKILPPITWEDNYIITTAIKNTKKAIAETKETIEEHINRLSDEKSITDKERSSRKKQIDDYYHFRLGVLKEAIDTLSNYTNIKEEKLQHLLNILRHLVGQLSAFYEDKLLAIKEKEIESRMRSFPEKSKEYKAQLIAITEDQLKIIREIDKSEDFLETEYEALRREMYPSKKTIEPKTHATMENKRSSSVHILTRTSVKPPEPKKDVAPAPAILSTVAETKRSPTSPYATPGVMSDPKHKLLNEMLESENPDIQQEAIDLATKLNIFYQEYKHDVKKTVAAYRKSLSNITVVDQVTTGVGIGLSLFHFYAKDWLSSDLSATISTIAKKPASKELLRFNAMTEEDQVKVLEEFLMYIKNNNTDLCKKLFGFFEIPEAQCSAGAR